MPGSYTVARSPTHSACADRTSSWMAVTRIDIKMTTAARMRASTLPLLMLSSTITLTTALYPLNPSAQPAWNLSYDYSGSNFFNNFQFYNGPDPTNGHVKYVDLPTANTTGLAGFLPDSASSTNPAIYLGVDYTSPTPSGRPSTRLSSIQTFNHALILADISHMPAPVCGVWPAYRMLESGSPWPEAGEIDILENVNDAPVNHYTLHTSPGNTTTNYTGAGQKGFLATSDCDVNAPDQCQNCGCSVTDASDVPSYGSAFNDNGGGVFATLIDAFGVRIWFFPRAEIPSDVQANTPNPPARAMHLPGSNSTWPVPNARFDGPENGQGAFDAPFRDMRIVINTAFCGDWAGKAWNSSETCTALAPTCEEYVTSHPEAFEDVWWEIQRIQVWEPVNGNWTVPYPGGSETEKQKRRFGGVAGPAEKRSEVGNRAKRDL